MKPIFNSREIDFQRDLEILQEATNYRHWLFDLIRPFLGRRILEIGSAIGNYTEKIISYDLVVATDYEEKYVQILNSRFRGLSNLNIFRLDITSVPMDMRNELIGFEIDTVLAMNVLEHVEDDIESIKTISDTIRPGGKIILICPAQTLLYNALDRSFGHYRRYDKRKIISLASTIQAKIIELRYFNPYGIMGWVFNGSVLKRGTLPRYQTKIFNSVIPLLKRIDYIISWPAGLSVLAVLEKR